MTFVEGTRECEYFQSFFIEYVILSADAFVILSAAKDPYIQKFIDNTERKD